MNQTPTIHFYIHLFFASLRVSSRLIFIVGENGFKNIHLPDCFPAVRDLYAADHKLYVVTFKKQSGNTEVLIFSTNGKFLKKIYLPLKEKNPEQLSPYSFYKNKFYQIVENEKENWELFITSIN